ncbi:hypothetical protein BH11ACT5_BH11ACT5_19920 [soil metagenome]
MTESQIWSLAVNTGVLILLAVFGYWNASRAANRAGTNSDAALARTIEADREARVLERRLSLYADIMTFVTQRRQNRDSVLQQVRLDGVEALSQYDPNDWFSLNGRAEAFADDPVLLEFHLANDAEIAIVNAHTAMLVVPATGQEAQRQRVRIEALRTAADAADAALTEAIRDLHR